MYELYCNECTKDEAYDMQHKIIRASELDKDLDFSPTIVFGFYGEHQRDSFVKTAEQIKKYFGNVSLIGCSSNQNLMGEAPYRVDETVLCLMDLKADAFTLLFSDKIEEENDTALILDEKKQHALLFYAGDEHLVQKGYETLQRKLQGGTLFGAIASADDTSQSGTLYYEGKFYDKGMVACLLDASVYDLKGVALHDFEPAGIELFVTKVQDNEILQIEDEPALDVIERIIGTITPNRLLMFDTPFFIKKAMLEKGTSFSLTSLHSINREKNSLLLRQNVTLGSKLKVAIPISKRSMKRRLWKIQKKAQVSQKEGALMLFFASTSLPEHWHEMEVLYMMNIINKLRLPFVGLHTLGEIAPLASQDTSALKDQTLTVISLSERSLVQ